LKISLDQEWGETVFFDQAGLTDMVLFAADRGWQIATHAYTPATDLMILNAYEAAILAHPDEDVRYRLEHIGVITDEGIQKMAELGVIGSVQFIGPARYVLEEAFIENIPQELWPLVARWRDLIDAGVLLVGNVDAPWCCTPWLDLNLPVTTGTVMTAIYEAATRQTYDGREPEPFQLSQVLTVAEALEMLTIRGAYAGHQENDLGSLTPGKYADLVVLSANPLDVPVEEILQIEVLLTMIGGQVEFCPPGQGEICP
jgi:predicted amidohydrolase YtcJ